MTSDRLKFIQARETTSENLEAIKQVLNACTESGLADPGAEHYNELLLLIDETSLSKTWDELMEVIAKAKILEIDIAAWLASKGKTTISFPWPKQP
jgi:hypothetical protein